MLYPIKIVDIELSRPLSTIEGLDGYVALKALVRLRGVPIGYIQAPVTTGCCKATTLSKLILKEHSWNIIRQLLNDGLAAPPQPEGLRLENLFDLQPPEYSGTWPLVTVAVCNLVREPTWLIAAAYLMRLDTSTQPWMSAQ